jgi:TetR/AcrR family transcriptional repressor of mexJK operon
MPRTAGQNSANKTRATLVAANQTMVERGFAAPIELIAKRAGVSKQTIYNRYGNKLGLYRAMVWGELEKATSFLNHPPSGETPEQILATFARRLMRHVYSPLSIALMRDAFRQGPDTDDLRPVIYETGMIIINEPLAAFLRRETLAGRMDVDNPEEAAQLFVALVSTKMNAKVFGLDLDSGSETYARRAAEIARLFVRGYGMAV